MAEGQEEGCWRGRWCATHTFRQWFLMQRQGRLRSLCTHRGVSPAELEVGAHGDAEWFFWRDSRVDMPTIDAMHAGVEVS